MIDLTTLLKTVAEHNGSDLHLKVGSPPLMRLDGKLHRLGDTPVKANETTELADAIVPEHRKLQFKKAREADFAHPLAGVGRFRVNVFHQRGSVSMVFRRVRIGSPSFDELGLPPIVEQFADLPRGLVLVTGPTGSGKTTTLAAMIEHINNTRPVHILTIEDPIEVLHPDKVATVNQREVGVDTEDYISALRAAMRQDPDVILIGEMRDMETVSTALAAGETGHLVLSTLHTTDAVETINRVVDFFPPFQQHQIRVTLASVLRGVISQRLVTRIGGGRIPALEVLVSNGRVADRILDPKRTTDIHMVINQGDFYGMQTFDQSLLSLVLQNYIIVEDAIASSTSPHDFALMLEQAGVALPV
jgi:twitching motility protein PilT